MPPALHPRSRMTLSLFWTTLGLSFAVVGLPHLLPCPVPHNKKAYADGQGRQRRRKKTPQDEKAGISTPSTVEEMGRECPIPKPSGVVGQVLGFEQKQKDDPVVVKVESIKDRRRDNMTLSKDTKP